MLRTIRNYLAAGAIVALLSLWGSMLIDQGLETARTTLRNWGITPALAQQQFRLPNGTQQENHQLVAGSQPTVSGGTIANGSTDMMGTVTATNAGNVTLTFATAWAVAPFCVITDNSSDEIVWAIVSLTTLTIHGSSAQGDKISYLCLGTTQN